MEKEQVAVDEAVETVAEENARAYSKTVWNESTPITADKLNKIENGIASALPLAGGTMTGSIILPNSTKGQIKQTLTNGTITPTLYITSGDNLRVGSADIENVCIYSKTNPKVSVDGSTYTLYHTGRKPTTSDIGALPISGGTLTGKIDVPGESTFYNGTYTDPWHGKECSIKASGHVGIGGSLKVNGKLEVGQDIKSPIFEASTDFIINRYGFSSFYTNNQNGALIHCDKNSSNITLADGKMVYANPNGNIEIGPQNTHHCHIYTDRPSFYFNKGLLVNGNHVYHEGNKPTAAAIGAMGTSSPTFEGNLYQNGPGGKDWIYHINADRGTLNIAPRNNGNPDWGKQIFIDRNGQLHCNGNRRVATINQENPAHHIIRYGAGMGGENGYITFSW